MFKNIIKAGILGAVALSLNVGCMSPTRVTYNSDPQGATLYTSRGNKGQCPVTLTYKYDSRSIVREGGAQGSSYKGIRVGGGKSSKQRINTPWVKWVSGAEKYVSDGHLEIPLHKHSSYTFIRPKGEPGVEIDAQYAIELRRNQLLEERNEAERDKAKAAESDAYWNSLRTMDSLTRSLKNQ